MQYTLLSKHIKIVFTIDVKVDENSMSVMYILYISKQCNTFHISSTAYNSNGIKHVTNFQIALRLVLNISWHNARQCPLITIIIIIIIFDVYFNDISCLMPKEVINTHFVAGYSIEIETIVCGIPSKTTVCVSVAGKMKWKGW